MSQQELHLSIVDRTIVKSYIRLLYIFPVFDTGNASSAIEALRCGLQRTLEDFPYLAGTVGPNHPRLVARYPDKVPDVVDSRIFSLDESLVEDVDYEDWKKRGMPLEDVTVQRFCPALLRQHPNIGSSFCTGTHDLRSGPVPSLAVQVGILKGGLVLSVYAHHVLVDGVGFALFVRRFADHVRDLSTGQILPSRMRKEVDHSALRRALDNMTPPPDPDLAIPEYTTTPLVPGPLLHSEPCNVASKIFVFSPASLSRLRDHVSTALAQRASIFVVLSALLWTSVMRAREAALHTAGLIAGATALGIAIDPRKHFPKEFVNYAGNLALLTRVDLPVSTLLATEDTALIAATLSISRALAEIDRDWVLRRHAYFSAHPAPHESFSTKNSPNFFVNDWQCMGAETEWCIPGTSSRCAEFVRRPFDEGEQGAVGIILPRRRGRAGGMEGMYEILVRLEEGDMRRFGEQIEGWVDRLVE